MSSGAFSLSLFPLPLVAVAADLFFAGGLITSGVSDPLLVSPCSSAASTGLSPTGVSCISTGTDPESALVSIDDSASGRGRDLVRDEVVALKRWLVPRPLPLEAIRPRVTPDALAACLFGSFCFLTGAFAFFVGDVVVGALLLACATPAVLSSPWVDFHLGVASGVYVASMTVNND